MENRYKSLESVAKQSVFSKTIHSIRTRYSLATAFFVLLALAVFYMGGRIVLVHLMREAEQQVKEIGYDISRLAYKQAEEIRKTNEKASADFGRQMASGASPRDILSRVHGERISLVMNLAADGAFVSGAVRAAGSTVALSKADVAPYERRLRAWAESVDSGAGSKSTVGIVQLRGSPHYVFMYPFKEGGREGRVVVGSAFDSNIFSSQVNEGFVGLDVRIVNRKADVTVANSRDAAREMARNDFGIAPMLSEAMNFYSGGFWNLGASPFEAVFAVRDIAGNAVSMITVSLPSSFSTVTRSALGRLTFFISVAGIFMILPIFWFQSHVLLNPLTKMTQAIRELGENHRSADCPYLEWDGKDEFAMLALSVNRMLETITARALEVAQVEARHRALIDAVPDALAVFDRRGRLVSVTKQADGGEPLAGFRPGEPLLSEVFGEEAADDFTRAAQSVFSGESVVARHLEVKRGSGDSPEAQMRNFEVRLARMDEVFSLAIIRDVTDEVAEHRLRLAAESRALDVSKRESLTLFAASIAHDVNNVLALILGTVDSVSAAQGENAEIAVVRDAAKRGTSMMKELMEFAGDGKVSLLRVSPEFLLHDVQSILERSVGRNVAVDYSIADALPDVDADPNKFWKVFFNIVKNAGEAIGDRPGHITLSVEAFEMTEESSVGFMSEGPLLPGEGVLFKVSDDGPGIRPEMLSRLFDPYVSSKAIGRGLGLATVRTIVETHGGGLKVESELGGGTTFSIYLPKTKLAAAAQQEEPSEKEGALPAEVLVVDDDAAILKTQAILLKALGVKAHVARDRIAAMGVVRRHAERLGAILLDAHIGGVDVVRLFQAFRIASPNVPVVIVSGSQEEEIRKMFKDRAYDRFLAKPFTLAELKSALLSLRES